MVKKFLIGIAMCALVACGSGTVSAEGKPALKPTQIHEFRLPTGAEAVQYCFDGRVYLTTEGRQAVSTIQVLDTWGDGAPALC